MILFLNEVYIFNRIPNVLYMIYALEHWKTSILVMDQVTRPSMKDHDRDAPFAKSR